LSTRLEKLRSGGVRFSKFSTVGLSNAAVDLGALNLLLWLEPTRDPVQLALYNCVALVLANANSYLWNTAWTFRGRASHNLRQTGLFVLQAGLNVAVSSGLFWLVVRALLAYEVVSPFVAGNIAKVISISVASTMSFFLMRYLVFSSRTNRSGSGR
jgi:putative flippase GtrA